MLLVQWWWEAGAWARSGPCTLPAEGCAALPASCPRWEMLQCLLSWFEVSEAEAALASCNPPSCRDAQQAGESPGTARPGELREQARACSAFAGTHPGSAAGALCGRELRNAPDGSALQQPAPGSGLGCPHGSCCLQSPAVTAGRLAGCVWAWALWASTTAVSRGSTQSHPCSLVPATCMVQKQNHVLVPRTPG